jgi:hypothetical protein
MQRMRPHVPPFSARSLLSKTDEGRAEMIRRTQRLDARARALLITLDGRQSLAALFAALGLAEDEGIALAHDLLVRGLARATPSATPPATAPMTADVTPAERRSLALARLYLMESMERALRGDTADLRPLLREATDAAGLLRALAACHDRLVAAGATAQAAVIRQRCLALMP